MTLERKAIRRAAVCALRGRTIAGQSVYDSRSEVFVPSGEEPILLAVYTLEDVPAPESTIDSPRWYGRDLELAVEVLLEEGLSGERREALLDDLLEQVENVLAALVPRLHRVKVEGRGLEVSPSKSGLERVEMSFERNGRALAGAARLVYLVHYGSEDEPLGECDDLLDLDSLEVSWDFPPPDDLVEATDEIASPEG